MNNSEKMSWVKAISTLDHLINSDPIQNESDVKMLLEQAVSELRVQFGDELVDDAVDEFALTDEEL